MKPLKVAISTVGCRANQADSASLARHLHLGRVEIVDGFAEVDVAVVNTCCVTAEAERDCRKTARRILAASPEAQVLLVGCAVNAVAGFGEGIDGRISTRGGKEADPRVLAEWINELARERVGDGEPEETAAPHRYMGRSRALLKIQTGCSHGCAYCIVPRARGKERSMPLSEILDEIHRIKEEGYEEAVITGVQLGAWGKELAARPTLAAAALAAADAFAPGRIRLSSIEPWSVDAALIEAVAGHGRICPHFHLPMQHGDDRILAAMRRGYTARQYLTIIEQVRKHLPDAAIGTDVLLGFPGEDEGAFRNTLKVLREMDPAYVHAFSYSPRPETRAAKMPDRPPAKVVKERNRQVRELGVESAERFRQAHLGQVREIVVEEKIREGIKGLTDTFVKVLLKGAPLESGRLVRAKLTSTTKTGLLGELPSPRP